MTSNYRVVRMTRRESGPYYEVREADIEDDGSVSWVDNMPALLAGSNEAEIMRAVGRIVEGLSHPALDADEIADITGPGGEVE